MNTDNVTIIGMRLKLILVSVSITLLSLAQGCAQIDYKRMTYEALRKQDCRINEPAAFCDRSYSLEYHEYAHLRQQFLQDEEMAQLKREEEEQAPAFGKPEE